MPAAILSSVFPDGSVHHATLPNGLRVLARRKAGSGVVAIVTYVGAGYFDETDDVVGVAHVLEHMYFKGTPSRGVGEIARATKANGGILNAATIYDHTHYYVVLPASAFEAGLDIQADAFAHSLIDAGELSRELEVIIEEAKRKADNPQALSMETLFALLHDQHRLRRWRIGREAGLRALTRAHVDGFYRNFYRPRNTVLAVVGDVDPAAAIAAVAARYGAIPDEPVVRTPGPVEPAPADGDLRYQELSGDVQQSELLLGWRTPGLDHPDTPIIDLATAVLSGGRAARLYRAVRDRRLASSISAWNYTPADLGVFVVHATTRPERAASAVRAAWDQVRRVREGDVTDVEVERARRLVSAQWMRRLETSEGQANHLAAWELSGGWQRGGDYLNALLAADAAAVGAATSRWLGDRRAALLVYRPASATPFAESGIAATELLGGDRPDPVEPVAAPTASASVHSGARAWRHERREGDVHVYRTASGVPILFQRVPGPVAHLGWFVRGGALAETGDRAGITSLMTRTAIRGTERRTAKQLAEDIEFAGGLLAASAGPDAFQWTVSVPAARLADAAGILADVVQRPAFAAEAVESERAVALADIAATRDDMYRWPLRLAFEAAWDGHPYGRQLLGVEASVGRLNGKALAAWHEAVALRAAGALICVADAEPDDAVGVIARHFGALEAADAAAVDAPGWPAAFLERLDERDKAQSALAMLFPGPSRRDESRFAAMILAGVASGLGGRFFDELRDRQSLAYVVQFGPVVRHLAGAFVGYIGTSPEKEDNARRGFLSEIARLRDEPVSATELARAQTYALGTHAIRRESAGSVLGDIADAWLFGESLEEIAQYEERVRAVTAADIQRIAREYFDPDRRVEGIIRGAGKTV
jgi:zinc protease